MTIKKAFLLKKQLEVNTNENNKGYKKGQQLLLMCYHDNCRTIKCP